MKKIVIIGGGNVSSCITAKLKESENDILFAKDNNEKFLNDNSNVYEFKNYHFLDSRSPSKSRLKKCEKGLHEFQETQFTTNENSIVKKQWFCKHCGTSMHNRG